MTRQIINIGTGPDSYTGDNLRVAFTKVNDNFAQLYAGNVGANTSVNVLSANSVATNGNINAGNVNVQYQVVSNGNITAAYFIGDGSQISNLPAGNYSNTNVASYLPTYSGNVNAAYYFGDGSQLTGITATANLGNLFVDGVTNQTLTGSTVGSLGLKPFTGNAVVMVLESTTAGSFANIGFQGFTNNLATISVPQANANLRLSSNGATITLGHYNHIGFNTQPSSGYDFNFNGEMFANAYYAAANFPVGYSFATPLGDTGLSHSYDITNGNISLLQIRHDSAEVAKFYENLTTILSGNLVMSQTGNVFGSFPNAFIQAYSSANTYTQLTWQNLSNASASTGDLVVTADTGTDTSYYIDMGMTGSGYDNTNPTNSLGTSVNALDGYFYVQGNLDFTSSPAVGGSLTLGTTAPGTAVKIITSGVNDSNIAATFTSGNITITSNTQGDSKNWTFDSSGNLTLPGQQSPLIPGGHILNVKGITGLTASSGAKISGFSSVNAASIITSTMFFSDSSQQTTAWTGNYTAANVSNWNGTPPSTISDAIDRLAAVVKVLNGGTGA